MLIKQTLPLKYDQLTQVFVSSTDKTYINKRLRKVNFYSYDFDQLVKIIEHIKEIDKKEGFLLKKEQKFIDHALIIFKKKNKSVKIEDYIKLLDYSFFAVVERLAKVQKELVHMIKQAKLQVNDLDNEYLFALQNILNQTQELCKDIKQFKWDDRNALMSLSRKAQMVYRNLHEIVLSLSFDQYEDIKNLSDTILDSLKIEFDTSNKILA